MLEKSTQMCRAPNTGSEPTAGKCAARANRDRLSPRRGKAEDTFSAIVLYALFLSLAWEREGGVRYICYYSSSLEEAGWKAG